MGETYTNYKYPTEEFSGKVEENRKRKLQLIIENGR